MLRRMPAELPSSPLSDIRILEVADESAAYGTRLLADFGAEVIMVEPPEGAPVRSLAPFLDDVSDRERGFEHLFLNINKRSVRVDIGIEEGREQFLDLLATADVLVDAGPTSPLPDELTDEVMRTARPDLLRISVRPYGLEGPWKNRTGNDLTALASGGLLSISGQPDDPPQEPHGAAAPQRGDAHPFRLRRPKE